MISVKMSHQPATVGHSLLAGPTWPRDRDIKNRAARPRYSVDAADAGRLSQSRPLVWLPPFRCRLKENGLEGTLI